jgi:hypothetical protein
MPRIQHSTSLLEKEKSKISFSFGDVSLSNELLRFFEDMCERHPRDKRTGDTSIGEERSIHKKPGRRKEGREGREKKGNERR